MPGVVRRYVSAGVILLLAGGRSFLANAEITLKGALDQAKTTIESGVTGIKDIATGIVFIIGIILVVWGYAARNKSNGDNDKMINAGIYALVAVALIEIFSALAGAAK